MKWALDKSKPLCPQICEQICLAIALDEFKPDEKVMSVRETAMAAGANPNTVQKAYESLEQNGILYSVRGSGWYVCSNTENAKNALSDLIAEKTKEFFNSLRLLKMSNEEIKNYVKEWDYE